MSFEGCDVENIVPQALLVNFDCCGLWVRDAEPLKAALSLTPEFLRARGNTLDYKVQWWCLCFGWFRIWSRAAQCSAVAGAANPARAGLC